MVTKYHVPLILGLLVLLYVLGFQRKENIRGMAFVVESGMTFANGGSFMDKPGGQKWQCLSREWVSSTWNSMLTMQDYYEFPEHVKSKISLTSVAGNFLKEMLAVQMPGATASLIASAADASSSKTDIT